MYCVRINGMGLRMSRWESLRSLLRRRDARRDAEQMLKMELDNLKFRFGRFDESKVASDVKKKLNDLFEEPNLKWDDAYQIENQIAMLLTGACLRQEITARLREARTRNATDAAVLQTDFDDLLKSNEKDDVLRYFLLQVLENINWQKKLKFLEREIRLEATRNTLALAFMALVLVLLPYFPWLSWLASPLYTALTFGLLGALFSRLITLQRPRSKLTLEELRDAKKFGYIFLRACIGACGALIIYFFFQSEMVKSDVFPKFMNGVMSSDGKNSALLIIWSFIAGFSEWLVRSVLSSTERQFGGAMAGRATTPES